MSDCNYCIHQSLKKDAEECGDRVTMTIQAGWLTALVHPPGADPFEQHPERSSELRYFAASYMELPESCCC